RAAAASGTGAAIPGLTPAFTEASNLFTVNRQAGIVSVFGTERQQRQIEIYLRALRKSVSAQVLIEAKILEVSLDDEFRFGVNWAMLGSGIFNAAAPFNTATTPTVAAPPFAQLIGGAVGGNTATANVFTLGIDSENFDAIANAVERFGTVRALSSPRVTVMQNQTAVLKVAEEQVFFEVTITQSTETTGDNSPIVTTASSTINTVTVGLVMTVQPSINLDTDEITLTLRPTITSVVRTRNDPAVDFQVAQIVPAPAVAITSQIPEVSVQEIDSVVTVHSGTVIVMGGLMRDRTTVTEVGVPLLADIPWLGHAFKSTERDTRKTELVIFLRATIIRNNSVDAYDIKLYDQFGNDRRPLVF
ncbi:MAG: type II and III secretion system protein, partial [Alphaproteobacteria bacterium]|nr:type II and III secretion system protein [Alphaproteobacteria bacterium]